ncbi:3'(2'),5'-bisphosphate nucleotidase CysQ [Acetobacter oeni]|uniref:3'(2'),5'-bisphosphate nucleotidase CysQ n=1 Tax=Acetobacter oeni TaxID=304077 RepID=A0A511XFV2_9PROT|nr:3'(2'),5'-bisphosphate nucleotidase CysQ [Acetobacter oeni]MBB3882245.1 3'(2'), 5'-bisphosphate nucleotidase [Acetobacter oeni]NHO18001.1 3'(2'),5'-bisphosphate nucleotidase CysQ [Acetobacter oeni]GBR01226.1 exopolysaccharide production protein [Acetobacter oeni LMG 21952]GEN61836.1 3'(2'),5'-bisphosphate nucleotidase CysQ [Acetobacter oeni]
MTTDAHPQSDTDLLALALRLAREAGDIINAIRRKGFVTTVKSDLSPVTEADQAAETHILKALRNATPQIPVIAEEEVAAGIHVAAGDIYWLIDPLDGTREFAAGRDDFTVNIGLVRNGRAVLGAMALPAYGQFYAGGAGLGAKRFDSDGEHDIHVRTAPAEGIAVLASRHHGDAPELKRFLDGHVIASIGNIGSAVKFMRVAEGVADFYPRLGPTMEWDTAAPQAIVEAAGGTVTLLDGTPLHYSKPGWKNPSFVCAGILSDKA